MSINRKIIIISLIVLIISISVISIAASTPPSTTSSQTTLLANGVDDTICTKVPNSGTTTTATLTTGGTVSMYGTSLRDVSVFCAQHGTQIVDGTSYTVGSVKYVTDPVLAYILAKGKVGGKDGEGNPYHYDPAQVALWMYLYDHKGKTDCNNIMGSRTYYKRG